jgi:hypothetical protein
VLIHATGKVANRFKNFPLRLAQDILRRVALGDPVMTANGCVCCSQVGRVAYCHNYTNQNGLLSREGRNTSN